MKPSKEVEATNVRREFEGATALADRRLQARLVSVAERIRAAPDQSFPDLVASPAELTALYRFLNNKSVCPKAILEPHIERTAERCAEARRVLVIHDTSEIVFSGVAKRHGLGPLRGKSDQGLLLHAALAVAGDGSRRPLGVIGSHTWARDSLGNGRTASGRKKTGGDYADDPNKESHRWWRLIDEVESHLGGVEAVHVFDREGDAYVLLRTALDNEARFVTRMARDRVVLDENEDRIGRVSELLVHVREVVSLEVPLSPRAGKTIPNSNPARETRIARLAIGATKMFLAPPNYIDGRPESLEVNVVYVHELGAPDGVEPIAWVLITNEPVDTPEQVRAVVEIYQCRWLIEEFFKALKTGCALEKRQLESYDSITAALAMFLPIAWQLLLLRNLARSSPDEPAELVLTPTQIRVLRAAVPAMSLPSKVSVVEALRAVAYLGGHFIRREPGWMVLGRGMEKLLDLEAGWRLARSDEK
jgi:hypothetical protein